jgi:hypothetical protein
MVGAGARRGVSLRSREVTYSKLSDRWRGEIKTRTLDGLAALGGVEAEIPNAAESKAETSEAVDSLGTEFSDNSINQSELDSRIRSWGHLKHLKHLKLVPSTKNVFGLMRRTSAPQSQSTMAE